MVETEPWIKRGNPIIGQIYDVPTDTKDEWLRHLNELRGITARVTEDGESAEGMTAIFVSRSYMYDRSLGDQARMGIPDPYVVMRRIKETMRYAAHKVSRLNDGKK